MPMERHAVIPNMGQTIETMLAVGLAFEKGCDGTKSYNTSECVQMRSNMFLTHSNVFRLR